MRNLKFFIFPDYSLFNPPPLNLSPLRGPVLCSKDTWRYLGFISETGNCLFDNISTYIQTKYC